MTQTNETACAHKRRVLVAAEDDGPASDRLLVCTDCGASRLCARARDEWWPITMWLVSNLGSGARFRLLRSRSPRTTHPAVPPRMTVLERRFLAAWRASGKPLMELMYDALHEYCYADKLGLSLLLAREEKLLEAMERWVREHPRGDGGQ
jgi:hypothetical protein